MFSGNYYALDGGSLWSEAAVVRFVEEFAYPVLEHIVAETAAGRPVDYEGAARQQLAALK